MSSSSSEQSVGRPEPVAGAGAGAVAVAYLAEGKLFTAVAGAKPQVVESHFAQEMLDRRERNRQRNEWRDGGMAWNFRGMVPGMRMPMSEHARPIRFECLARARE